MNESEKKRAKLDFGDDEKIAVSEKPAIDPETIRGVSARVGFRKTGIQATRKASGKGAAPPRAVAGLPKRTRRKTGRVHQFSTRIDRATYEAIYKYADHAEITLGETIERAMVSLNGGPLKKPANLSTDKAFPDGKP